MTCSATPPPPDAASSLPDWGRLQQALSIEADRGFNNLQGNQYQFHEFLHLSLQQIPPDVPTGDFDRWQRLTEGFSRYPELSFGDRRHLVAETRQSLHRTRKAYEQLRTEAVTKVSEASSRTAPSRTTPSSAPNASQTPASSPTYSSLEPSSKSGKSGKTTAPSSKTSTTPRT
ncbi:MAG: hypothetical protein ACO34J_13145, partial [Prochlorothrix sp.]